MVQPMSHPGWWRFRHIVIHCLWFFFGGGVFFVQPPQKKTLSSCLIYNSFQFSKHPLIIPKSSRTLTAEKVFFRTWVPQAIMSTCSSPGSFVKSLKPWRAYMERATLVQTHGFVCCKNTTVTWNNNKHVNKVEMIRPKRWKRKKRQKPFCSDWQILTIVSGSMIIPMPTSKWLEKKAVCGDFPIQLCFGL